MRPMGSGRRLSKVIEEGYEKKGVGKKAAERHAWATENKVEWKRPCLQASTIWYHG